MRGAHKWIVGLMVMLSLTACAPDKPFEWFGPDDGTKHTGPRPDKCDWMKPKAVPDAPKLDAPNPGWVQATYEIEVRATLGTLPGVTAPLVDVCVPVAVHIFAMVNDTPMPLVNEGKAIALPLDVTRNTPAKWTAVVAWDPKGGMPSPEINIDFHAKWLEELDYMQGDADSPDVVALTCLIKQNGVPIVSALSLDVRAPQGQDPVVKNGGKGPYIRCKLDGYRAVPA